MSSSTVTAHPNLALPPGWERLPAGGPPVRLRQRPSVADPSDNEVPEVVVVCSDAPDGEVFVRRCLRELDWADLEDLDSFEFDDIEVTYARIAHRGSSTATRTVGAGSDVISEIWWRIEAGHGWAVIATVTRATYPDWCDLLEDLAGTLEIV